MRAGPDIITSINTNLAELSGTWLWSTEDVYSPDYLDILNKRYNQDTSVWDEIPISVEAVTIDFLRWKVNEAVIVIRKTPDPTSEVVWSGIVYTIPDDAGQGTSLVSKNVYSTGVFDSTPPTFLDNGDGTLSVGPANVNLYLNSTFTGSLDTYQVPAKLLTPTDNGQQFVVVDITTGTPEYRLENSFQAINHSNVVVIAQVWRVGNKVRWIDANSQGKGLGNKTSRALFDTTSYLVSKDGGLTVSETSTPAPRTLLITSGVLYAGVVPHQIPAFDSSTDVLVWTRHVAGTWTYSNTAVYDNLYYDNGTDLVAVTVGNYSVGWIYRAAGGGNETYFVKSGQQYTSFALAEADTQRNDLPYIITGYCKLLARVIIQQGASSGVVQNITSTVFQSSGAVSNHNSLSGLQGGVSGQYYHFTNTEHTNLTSPLVQGIGGLSSSATGTLKYVSGTATLDTTTYLQQSDVTGVSGHIAVFIDTHTVAGDVGFTRFIYGGLTRWVKIGAGTATSDCFLALDGTTGYGKQIQFKSNSSPIWIVESAAATEAFTLSAYNTSEVLIDTPLVVQRAAGGTVIIGGASRPVQITSLGTGIVKATSGVLAIATAADLPGGPYQPLDGDLTAIAGLAGTAGLARKTAANTWSLDTSTYLTANQSITWTASGDVSGTASGTTSISPTLTVTAIQGKAITLATGFLKYNGTSFSFDNASYITLASLSATSPILYNSATGVFSHAVSDGNLHVPATGTSNSGKVLTAGATAGSLSWTTPATGTVTSVGLSAPSIFTVSGSPVTSTGTLTFAFNGAVTSFLLADGTTVARSTYAAASDLLGYLPLTAGSGKALTGVLYGTGLNFTSTSDSPLLISHNLAGAFTHPLQAFNSGMVAGNQYNFDFGQAASNYNAGKFGFKYVGAGLTTNYITLGLYGANDLLKITGAGIATFSGSVVTPALTIGALSGTLIGTSGVVSALSGTNLVLGNGTTIPQSTFLTGNQTITLSGDVTGSGTTAITTAISAATVTGKALTGYAVGTNTALAATDTILGAFGKIQAQINARPGTVTSVGLSAPSIFTVSGSPVTGSGTLSFAWNGSSANLVRADGSTVSASTYLTGSGSGSYIPMWSGSTALSNSPLFSSTGYGGITNTASSLPAYSLVDTSQASNAKNWTVRASGSAFVIDAFNDAWTNANRAVSISRSGNVIGNMSLQSSSINLTALTSAGFVKTNASGLLSVDTNNYAIAHSLASNVVLRSNGSGGFAASQITDAGSGTITLANNTIFNALAGSQINLIFRNTTAAWTSFYAQATEAGFRDYNDDGSANSFPIYWTRGTGGLIRLSRPVNFLSNIQVGGMEIVSSSRAATFSGLTIGALSGMLKASSGVVSAATSGTDYLSPTNVSGANGQVAVFSGTNTVGSTDQVAWSGTIFRIGSGATVSRALGIYGGTGTTATIHLGVGTVDRFSHQLFADETYRWVARDATGATIDVPLSMPLAAGSALTLGRTLNSRVVNIGSGYNLQINGTEVISSGRAFSGTNATMSGSISWDGGILRNWTGSSSLGAMYASGATPNNNNNYVLAYQKDGAVSWLGGTTSAGLVVNGTARATATSTGLAITGALSATSLVGPGTRMVTAAADGTLGATSWAYNGPWLPLAGGTLNSGAQIATNRDVTPSASQNTNYMQAPIIAQRASNSGTTTVAAVGFHNLGVNAAALYYVPSSDPAQSFFRYNQHTGGIVTLWDSSNLSASTLPGGPYLPLASGSVHAPGSYTVSGPTLRIGDAQYGLSAHGGNLYLWSTPAGQVVSAQNFASLGAVAATTSLAWGGGILRDHYIDASYTALYGAWVGSYGSNYTLLGSKDGQISWLGGTVSSGLAVNAAEIATATSAGLAVTGALTASGLITSGLAAMGTWTVAPDTFAWFGAYNQNNGTYGNSGYLQDTLAGVLYACAPSGSSFNVQINNVNKLTIDSSNSTFYGLTSNTQASVGIPALLNVGIVISGTRSVIYKKDVDATIGYPMIVGNWNVSGYWGIGNAQGVTNTIKIGRVGGNATWVVQQDPLPWATTAVTNSRSGVSLATTVEMDSVRLGVQYTDGSTRLLDGSPFWVMPSADNVDVKLPLSPKVGCAFCIFRLGGFGRVVSITGATSSIATSYSSSATTVSISNYRTLTTGLVVNDIRTVLVWTGTVWMGYTDGSN